MKKEAHSLSIRWLYLVVGVVAMLFAGIIYGWSILRAPLEEAFHWSLAETGLTFTLTMSFFCIGAFAGSIISKRIGTKASVVSAGLVAAAGLFLTSTLSGSIAMLNIYYGALSGLGIGVAYNVMLSTISAWFPDKKGLCSGVLLMGYGASSLVLGKAAGMLIQSPDFGWRFAFRFLGVSVGAVLVIAGLILCMPPADTVFPKAENGRSANGTDSISEDFTTVEMIRRPTFWRAFLCIVFLAAVGSSVISFASQLSQSVGAGVELATTLVGVLSICNGFGRILTGAMFDSLGCRKTMICANVLTIAASGVTLISVLITSLPLCIIGLCLTGMSFGACPTITSAFTSAFYGAKHFSMNFSIMNFNLMGASFLVTASSELFTATGGYLAPFIMLLALSVIALGLNISIRKP